MSMLLVSYFFCYHISKKVNGYVPIKLLSIIGPYSFYIEKFVTQFKTTEEIIGHGTRFRENDDLPPWRSPVVKKKPPFF